MLNVIDQTAGSADNNSAALAKSLNLFSVTGAAVNRNGFDAHVFSQKINLLRNLQR